MSTSDQNQNPNKKMSLEEAIKQKLAKNKQTQQQGKHNPQSAKSTKKMTSQLAKRPSNQGRRTGYNWHKIQRL